MKCVTDEYVLEIIKSLKSKDSTGNDKISSKLLKQLAPTIHSILRLIINQSINTGIFPEQLKLAIVKPLFKNKGENCLFGNYRPISLLSTISKVFERVVFNQLYAYMDSNSLFLNSQYGFRKNHSTEQASLEFVDRIAKDIEAKKVPLSVFIDLSKAFDTLDHEILLKKLKYYGITGVALSWFQSYLSNRQQMVDFDGILSIKLELKTGVPQGSILGPLLFIIYMNDIVGACALFHDILFADDTSLISTLCKFFINVPQNTNDHNQINMAINLELKKLINWLNVNKLSLNTDKTNYMIFQSSKSRDAYNWLDLKINNKAIKRVNTFNFLGLTLNKQLNWNDHINSVANKISSTVGVLNKLKKFLPTNILKQIYSSLILPRLYYCNLIWGYKPKRISNIQKRAIRIICKQKYNAHTEPLFKKLNMLTVEDIHISKKLSFYYQFENDKLPAYFWTYMFHANSNNRTRNKDPYQPLGAKSTVFSDTIRFSLPILLRNTPPAIKVKVSTHSYDGFKTYVKKVLLGRYKENCTIKNCYICTDRLTIKSVPQKCCFLKYFCLKTYMS